MGEDYISQAGLLFSVCVSLAVLSCFVFVFLEVYYVIFYFKTTIIKATKLPYIFYVNQTFW